MTGIDTNIAYQDLHQPLDKEVSGFPMMEGRLPETSSKTMFLLGNSSVSLTNINLDSTSGGSRVGTLSSSILTLRCCEIFSNIECSPFAVGDGWGSDGSSILVVSSSHRCPSSNSLLPLVSLLPVRERQANQPGASESASSVYITAIGLSIANSHILVGTGPLLDFGSLRNGEAEQIALSTTLSSCVLSNTTSSPSQSISGVPSGTCQKIVGCGISKSTNHLYGTACNDMNLGGSILTRNTSFVLCTTNFYYRVYSTRSLIEANSDFEFCTFKKCYTGQYAGALYMYWNQYRVTIKDCAFDSCSAYHGGAIYCYASDAFTSFTLWTSSFVHCRAEIAGSVYTCNHSLSIKQCSFFNSTSQYSAGAVLLANSQFSSTCENLLFDTCQHEAIDSSHRCGGGALEVQNTVFAPLNYLMFRNCYSAADTGHDIFLNGLTKDDLWWETWDSTSPSTNRISEWKGIDRTSEMPNPTNTAKVLSLTSTESGYSGQLTLTLDKPATGTFFVVLDNAYGTQRTNPDFYPNIGRLVMFPFSDSASSTLSVGIDNWDVLQSPLHGYMLHAVSMNEWEVVQPTFTTVEVNRDESGTIFDFTLKGKDVPNGTYTIILDDDHELDVDVTTDNTGESEGFGSIRASVFDRGISAPKQYYVVTVLGHAPSHLHIVKPGSIPFDLVTPAYLGRLLSASFVDSAKTQLEIIIDSKYLEKNKKYTLVLGKRAENSEQHTFEIWTDSEGTLLPLVVTLDPYETDPEEKKKKLQLGQDYSPLSLTGEGRLYSVALLYFFTLPVDPPRTVGIGSQTLNKRKNELTITIQGRLFESSISSLSLKRGDRVIQSTSVDFISNEMVEATFAVGFVETDDTLSFGEEYTLLSLAGQDDVAMREGVVVVVPSPPFVSSITASPHPSSPTQFSLIFEGQDLPSNLVLLASVDSFPPIAITVSADGTSGTTSFLNGGNTALMGMSKTYTVNSLTMEDDTNDYILLKQNSFTTPPGPEALQLIVNSESSDTTRQCGSSTSPCQSVDVAWVILSELAIRRPTIAIQTAAQLESLLQISERISLTFTKDGSKLATLSIPSTVPHKTEEGLIVVDGGVLSIEDVHVVIESTDVSFIFVSANKATISLKGSFSGHATSTNSQSNSEENDEVCSWRSGVFQLDDCSTSVTFSTFSNLSQGAIEMRKGTLNIDTTAFHDNTPKLESFGSLRRNIHCSDGGNVVVGTLSGGDGVQTHSPWFSLEGCSLDALEEIKDAPFFVPTLLNSSTSTYSKKEKHFAIEIAGATLIPCGLSLEVFEVSKDDTVGQSTRLPLTLASTSSFTHTSITLTIPDSSLSSLSSSLAWHGRLVFGSNLTTTESFVVQKSSVDRYAQTTKENMKWRLPLVISLIVLLVIGMLIVFICWRRRNQNKTKQESEPQEQELQPEDKVEVEDNAVLNLQNMTDKASLPAFTDSETTVSLPTSNHQPLKSAHQPVMEVLSCGEKCEVVTIPVADTLFNKLHRQGSSFDKRAAQKQLTKGVNALVYLKPDTSILLTLSPHTVLMDKLNNVFLQINMDSNESQTTMKDEKEKTEGQRWQAPEVTEKKDRVDPNKASVFSLGLILWEIETGLVPFGEQEAVNACRQVTAGILPSMEKVVDAEFADLLLKCLSVNPVDRPTLGELSSFLETHSFQPTVENSKGEL